MKIRTIRKEITEIKKEDPGTCITERALRRAVLNGEIPSRRVGDGKNGTFLVEHEKVLRFFGCECEGELNE